MNLYRLTDRLHVVSAQLMARERTLPVFEGLTAALATYGVPEQILTDIERYARPIEDVWTVNMAGKATRAGACSVWTVPDRALRCQA